VLEDVLKAVHISPVKVALILAGVAGGFLGTIALAEEDRDSIEGIKATRIRNGTEADPRMKRFAGAVYEGQEGAYWISGDNIFTPNGECIRRVGDNYFTPEGVYRKVGENYFKPDQTSTRRVGNTYLSESGAVIDSGNAFNGGSRSAYSSGSVVIINQGSQRRSQIGTKALKKSRHAQTNLGEQKELNGSQGKDFVFVPEKDTDELIFVPEPGVSSGMRRP